jgi:hypothetical protein
MRQLTFGDSERLKRAQAFQDSVDEDLHFRGRRRASEDLMHDDCRLLAIARESRLLAGFTEEEIRRLAESARRSAA